jgi:hypothetical protein
VDALPDGRGRQCSAAAAGTAARAARWGADAQRRYTAVPLTLRARANSTRVPDVTLAERPWCATSSVGTSAKFVDGATTGAYTSTDVDPNVSNSNASTLARSVLRRAVPKSGRQNDMRKGRRGTAVFRETVLRKFERKCSCPSNYSGR